MASPHPAAAFRFLTTAAEFDAALAQSATRPVVIFKHSPTCGTSAHAYDEMQTLLAGPPLEADVFLVDVLAGRALSQAIAAALKIRHESPQVLLVSGGAVRWQASHYGVTAKSVTAALMPFAPE